VRFLIENFGPVKEADILKKPLTIFIGPNATGKSYITYLLWCLFSTEPDFGGLVQKLPKKGISVEKLGEAAKKYLLELFEDPKPLYLNLEDHLKDTFMVDDIKLLTKAGAERFKFKICSDKEEREIEFEITDKGLGYTTRGLTKAIEKNLKIETKFFHRRTSLEMLWNEKSIYRTEPQVDPRFPILYLIPPLCEMLLDGYYPYADTFIAPDGRAGLMRAREPIVRKVFKTPKPVPMSAVDLAFMGDIEALDPRKKNKETEELADFIEEMLNVEFQVRRTTPRYVVRMRELEIPLQNAPSGYRELAPLVLILRHAEEETLFIEEPEAHLHPDAQIAIARGLAGVSKMGTDIMMTTHSIYVLDEVSNLLRLKKLREQDKKELGYKSWEGLAPKDVAIYFFSTDGDVEPIKALKDELSESGLDKIILQMANKHAEVERLFEKRKT
jgi:AAA15 family ATPase/GTPase